MLYPNCKKGARCLNHRKCETCALARAYKFAISAELNTPPDSLITYAVIRPDEPRNIYKLRKTITKWSTINHKGHCWSVEVGESVLGLHVNIIIASEVHIKESEIVQAVGVAADIWAGKVKRNKLQTIARYINKPSGIPSSTEFNGRTFGRSGCMLRPLDYLARSSNGLGSLVAQEILLEKAGFPADVVRHPALPYKHLPNITNVMGQPHAYEPYAIDNTGQVINNPNHVPHTD